MLVLVSLKKKTCISFEIYCFEVIKKYKRFFSRIDKSVLNN